MLVQFEENVSEKNQIADPVPNFQEVFAYKTCEKKTHYFLVPWRKTRTE